MSWFHQGLVQGMGKPWHPDCFACAQCEKPLSPTNYLEKNNKPYCDDDYHNKFLPKCSGCQLPISDVRIDFSPVLKRLLDSNMITLTAHQSLISLTLWYHKLLVSFLICEIFFHNFLFSFFKIFVFFLPLFCHFFVIFCHFLSFFVPIFMLLTSFTITIFLFESS